jgi:hypothetical protein
VQDVVQIDEAFGDERPGQQRSMRKMKSLKAASLIDRWKGPSKQRSRLVRNIPTKEIICTYQQPELWPWKCKE